MEFARAKAGHDAGSVYLLYKEEEKFVYLADGKLKTLASPKRKNPKHVQRIKNLPNHIKEMEPEEWTDALVKKILKAYEEYLNCSDEEEGKCQKQMSSK